MPNDAAVREKLLRVTAPHFVAGAVWRRTAGGWVCTGEVAPILAWMRGMKAEAAAAYLQRKGWGIEWLTA